MAKHRKTILELAKEAQMDVDDVLLALWEFKFDTLNSPNDIIYSGNLNKVQRILGISTRREFQSPKFWMDLFQLNESDFYSLLNSLAIEMNPKLKILPKKAPNRLKAEARRRGINPFSKSKIVIPCNDKITDKTPALIWKPEGHERDLRWLTEDEVKQIHFELVNDFNSTDNPIFPPGIRDNNIFCSAIYRPQTSNGGILKYPTIESSAAALLHALILDHPFYNGNKRTALVAFLVFLDENGLFPEFSEDDIFKYVLFIAQHHIVDFCFPDLYDREILEINNWICSHTRLIEKENKTISYRKLKNILNAFDCKFEQKSKDGTRVFVTRAVNIPFLKKFSKTKILKTQIHHHEDGNDVKRNAIKKIREDLELDDLHHIDSRSFYSKDSEIVSGFISKYRKTLSRLAKF